MRLQRPMPEEDMANWRRRPLRRMAEKVAAAVALEAMAELAVVEEAAAAHDGGVRRRPWLVPGGGGHRSRPWNA